MTSKPRLRQLNIKVPDDLRDGLETIRERDGVAVSEQVRRAIRRWLDDKQAMIAPAKARKAS